MLSTATAPTPFGDYRRLDSLGQLPAQVKRRALVEEATQARLLARYLEGWAEADPVKIADAIAPGYCFDDPFVGRFSILALPRYFEALRSKADLGAPIPRRQVSFLLRGPMDGPPARGALEYWREAPRLGLTGTTLITVGRCGVIAERVAYDLNIASEQLRRPNADA